jgi:hypothetical protein
MIILLILLSIYILSAYINIKLIKYDDGKVDKNDLILILFPGINTVFSIVLGFVKLEEITDKSNKNGALKCIGDAIVKVLNKL